jgi:hypothetical protein
LALSAVVTEAFDLKGLSLRQVAHHEGTLSAYSYNYSYSCKRPFLKIYLNADKMTDAALSTYVYNDLGFEPKLTLTVLCCGAVGVRIAFLAPEEPVDSPPDFSQVIKRRRDFPATGSEQVIKRRRDCPATGPEDRSKSRRAVMDVN